MLFINEKKINKFRACLVKIQKTNLCLSHRLGIWTAVKVTSGLFDKAIVTLIRLLPITLLIGLVIFVMPIITGCNKERPVIFLSSQPITRETFSPYALQRPFIAGERINFVIFNPKPFTSDILKIQILKLSDTVGLYSYSIAQGREIEIDTRKNYAIDSFFINKEGNYVLRIFNHDQAEKPLAEVLFKVEPK